MTTTPTSVSNASDLASAACAQIKVCVQYVEQYGGTALSGAIKALHPGLNQMALSFETAMSVPEGTYEGVAHPADGDPKKSS